MDRYSHDESMGFFYKSITESITEPKDNVLYLQSQNIITNKLTNLPLSNKLTKLFNIDTFEKLVYLLFLSTLPLVVEVVLLIIFLKLCMQISIWCVGISTASCDYFVEQMKIFIEYAYNSIS